MTFWWRYRRLTCVGQGSGGAVYRARHRWTRKVVALKELALGVGESAHRRRRLRREARALAALEHPGIVRLVGIEERGARMALAMEFVDGATLARLLEAGPLPLEAAVYVARCLLSALDYAHARGVVHRDASPRNVLLARDGAIKLADFGIARLVGSTRTAGVSAGTVPYMAPEQILGAEVDGRADLFAVGVLLYALITGEAPFAAVTVQEMEARILSGRMPLEGRVPSALAPAITGLLALERERRTATASEALAALPDDERGCEELTELLDARVPVRAPGRRLMPWALAAGAVGLAVGLYASQGASDTTMEPSRVEEQPAEQIMEIALPVELEPEVRADEPASMDIATVEEPVANAKKARRKPKKRRIRPEKVEKPAVDAAVRNNDDRPDWVKTSARRPPWKPMFQAVRHDVDGQSEPEKDEP